MAYEMLMGLNVIDDAAYQAYREAMMPILEDHGGGFGYDFRVSEVLKSATDAPINRVFTIHFPDENSKNAFFSNAEYLEVRQRLFEAAVTESTMIAKYER
jgi:uncharacterized protein (DUF1330 family)